MFSIKSTGESSVRPLSDYSKVQKIIGRLIRNRGFFIDRQRIRSLLYLNVGCGPNIHDDLINLDFEWRPGIDVCWDMRRPFPLETSSLQGIFSEHCLEHVSLNDTMNVVREFLRVLRPGGVARISVPDGGLYLKVYAEREFDLNHHSADAERQFPYEDTDKQSPLYSPIVSVNRIAREHGHLYLYDFSLLKLVFEQAGFVNITREDYLRGKDPVLLIDSEHRAVESLYLEATAPV